MRIFAADGADPPASGWFLLLWCAGAIVMCGRLATVAGAERLREKISRRRGTIPPSLRTIRRVAGVCGVAGVILIPVGIWLIIR
jgi:hypothetical protein